MLEFDIVLQMEYVYLLIIVIITSANDYNMLQ